MRRIAALAAAFGFAAAAQSQDFDAQSETLVVKEWRVPNAGRARDPFAVDADVVWFVDQVNGALLRLDGATGAITRKKLPEGSGPHNLIVDESGAVWFAGNRNAYIGRYDPQTEDMGRIAMPDPDARDPHTLVFDANGDIWFTVQGGNVLGKLTLADGKVQLIEVPVSGARPYGIIVAQDGTVWATLFGLNMLASVDPETMVLATHALPRDAARPRRLAETADGRVWYVDYAEGYLGAMDPGTGAVREWRTPSAAGAYPYGMAVDAQDRIWFVETGPSPNRFVGFDPRSEAFIAGLDIPSGGGTVRHMHAHHPSNRIWFGTDVGTVGYVEPH